MVPSIVKIKTMQPDGICSTVALPTVENHFRYVNIIVFGHFANYSGAARSFARNNGDSIDVSST